MPLPILPLLHAMYAGSIAHITYTHYTPTHRRACRYLAAVTPNDARGHSYPELQPHNGSDASRGQASATPWSRRRMLSLLRRRESGGRQQVWEGQRHTRSHHLLAQLIVKARSSRA